MALVNMSAIMERTDEQLLPAVYAFVAISFKASPSQLGYITQSRALLQALASPLAGIVGMPLLCWHLLQNPYAYRAPDAICNSDGKAKSFSIDCKMPTSSSCIPAGHRYNRTFVIALGCSIWGVMTALFSGCSTLTQGYLLWAVNGIGLALVVPTGQSLTADYYPDASRGLAFGTLYLTGAFGAMLGGFYATNMGMALMLHANVHLPQP